MKKAINLILFGIVASELFLARDTVEARIVFLIGLIGIVTGLCQRFAGAPLDRRNERPHSD